LFILDYIYNKGAMSLKKIGIAIGLAGILLSSCNSGTEEQKTSANVQTKTISHLKWKEPVSQIDFTILNPDKISNKKLKTLKSDIDNFMPHLVQETEGLLERRSSIIITLYKKEGYTNSIPGSIDIYNNMFDTSDIGWFLADAAFKNNSYYKETYRDGPRVGLDWFLEVKYGHSPVHPHEEFLYNRDLYSNEYPISIQKNIDDLWRTNLNEELSNYNYFLNSSFYLFLIESYGLETYLPLLDAPQNDETFLKLFGKTLKQLEADWLASL
jgi:hypothetical protein